MDRQNLFSGSGAVRKGQEIDLGAIDAWMRDHVADYAGPLTVEQFKGGQSNPTYKLITPAKTYVLRRKPPGQLLASAHAVDREYRVITAVHGTGFPVARTYGLCLDDAVIGTWFYVMDCVEGRVFWDTSFPDVDRADRPRYFDAMNATLAALHSTDPVAIGLGDYGKPGNYFARQIGRWSKQYVDDPEAGRYAAMDRLVEWLPSAIPPGDETSIVHGDYRSDNMIFHPTEPKVAAVLDWELSTLGHPLADFSYHLMMWFLPREAMTGMLGRDFAADNIPTAKAYAADYCKRTGRDLDASGTLPNLAFYLSYNLFRLAAITHGIQGRVVRGSAASAHAVQMGAMCPKLADLAWEWAENSMKNS
jgi:aminoglycoside phosphotransferase (APT) family kinase protein